MKRSDSALVTRRSLG